MKRSLHPGAIAAVITVFVVALGAMFVQLGGRETAKSDAASPFTKVGERPPTPGSGVNSITGEPLSNTAKAYEAAAHDQNTRR